MYQFPCTRGFGYVFCIICVFSIFCYCLFARHYSVTVQLTEMTYYMSSGMWSTQSLFLIIYSRSA